MDVKEMCAEKCQPYETVVTTNAWSYLFFRISKNKNGVIFTVAWENRLSFHGATTSTVQFFMPL